MKHYAKYVRERSISLESYRPHTHTHARTHTAVRLL